MLPVTDRSLSLTVGQHAHEGGDTHDGHAAHTSHAAHETPPASHAASTLLTPALTFRQVFESHGAYVLGLLRRLGVPASDVDDVAQEVFLAVHTQLPTFEGRSSLKTWLCGIALRKAMDCMRSVYRRRDRQRELRAQLPPVQQPAEQEQLLLRDEVATRLQAALGQLSDKQRAVFVLYEIEELPMTDVARVLGCPRFTAYTRLHAARLALRAQLRDSTTSRLSP